MPLVSPSPASNAVMAGDQDASTSQVPSQSESTIGPNVATITLRKPTMSKVILRTVADKGARSRVSLAALKKSVSITGYKRAQNTWRFKRVLQNPVKKGMLKQVTGKGASGSLRMGKNQAFKSKRRVKKRQRKQTSGQRRSGPRRSLLGSK